jgi:TPP-dependent indolepyruvate ferredoxin oxidoreductase alpha subunit
MGGIVMMAGNARSVLDLIDEQVEYLAGVDGPPSDEAKEEVRKIKQPPRRSAPERPRA